MTYYYFSYRTLRRSINSYKERSALKKYEESKSLEEQQKPPKIDIIANPPAEVREAAADMGLSVEDYKGMYLSHLSFCEAITNLYDACLKAPAGDIECFYYLPSKEILYNCYKFENKYSAQRTKYLT